ERFEPIHKSSMHPSLLSRDLPQSALRIQVRPAKGISTGRVALLQLRRQQPDRRYACRLHDVNHFSDHLKFYGGSATNECRMVRARSENLFQSAAQRFPRDGLLVDL